MKAQRKHRPGWDDGFFMARTDPERVPKPRLKASKFELPKFEGFDRWRLVTAWRAVGVMADPERVLGHALMLDFWLHEREPRK
jgi:hypothetical protein